MHTFQKLEVTSSWDHAICLW